LEVISDVTGFIHEEIKLVIELGEEEHLTSDHPTTPPQPQITEPQNRVVAVPQPEKPNLYFKLFEISPIRTKLTLRMQGGQHHGAVFEWVLRGLGTLSNIQKSTNSSHKN